MSSTGMPWAPRCSLRAKRSERRIAEAELELGRRIEAAIGQIAARLGAGAPRQRRLEELGGELEHVMQRLAVLLARVLLAAHLRQRHAGLRGQPLHRLRKRQPFGHHHEVENVAVLAATRSRTKPSSGR